MPVTPDLDFMLAGDLGFEHLAADSRRSFLTSPRPGTERSVDVVEARHSSFKAVVLEEMTAHAFAEELLPTVAVFRVGRVGVFFLERGRVGFPLLVAGVDAGAGCVEEALNAIDARGFDGVHVDHRAVTDDDCFICLDEADSTHLRSQGIDFIHSGRGLEAVIPAAQVQ